ncbi:MAG: hypothetical protein EXR79_10750 [Myxococcales bacterium]|nr:hypothetical protein [Myxococcales bacterium]
MRTPPSDRLIAVLHQGDPTSLDPPVVNACHVQRDLCEALAALGWRTEAVFLDAGFRWVARLLALGPALVFNAADLGFRNDITLEPHIAAVLAGTGLEYTGSTVYASAFSSDKYASKVYAGQFGVPVPRVWLATEPDRAAIELPVILKTRMGHNSFGLTADSVCFDRPALNRALDQLADRAALFVLEEYIDGDEAAAAFLGNAPPTPLPHFAIAFGPTFAGRPRILDYAAKWQEQSAAYRHSMPAPATFAPELTRAIDTALLRVVALFGLRDYARIDVRIRPDASGRLVPYVIDINANPDLSRDAGFFRMARAAGMDYSQLVGAIVGAALARPSHVPAPGAASALAG